MTSAYVFWLNACTDNIALGDSFAAMLGGDVGDKKSFTNGIELSGGGRGVSSAATQKAMDRIAEYNTAGPWPLLNAIGATDAKIIEAKKVLFAECGQRAIKEGNAAAFWSSNGFTVVVKSLFP